MLSISSCSVHTQGVWKVRGHFAIQINDSFRNRILMKVFQFYVHCFLWPLLKYQYPACPPLFCITFLSRCGMERASSHRLTSGMFRQACRNLDFSPPIVLGIGSLHTASSMMLHRFSVGLRSGECAGHSSFWIKSGRLFLHLCWVAFAVWDMRLNTGIAPTSGLGENNGLVLLAGSNLWYQYKEMTGCDSCI